MGGPETTFTPSPSPSTSTHRRNPPKKTYRPTTTWHLKPLKTFSLLQPSTFFTFSLVDQISRDDLGPLEMYEPRGEDFDRGPVPHHPIWRENVFILKFALVPIIAQWALLTYTNVKITGIIPQIIQYALYQLWFIAFATHTLRRAQRFMQLYGTLNENKRGRDLVPDSQHARVTYMLVFFIFVRNIGVFWLGKDRAAMPSLSIWSPIKLGGFLIALDYFFYMYHRASHDIPTLWFVHRQHHATLSPTPSMSLWADELQDALEWMIVPFGAFTVVKLTFAELYIVSLYTLYVEAMGHSGIRAYWAHPLLTPVLKPLGMELAIEDHDLHHRYGRAGKNFGKQSRVWDKIFGTIAPREEEAKYEAFKKAHGL